MVHLPCQRPCTHKRRLCRSSALVYMRTIYMLHRGSDAMIIGELSIKQCCSRFWCPYIWWSPSCLCVCAMQCTLYAHVRKSCWWEIDPTLKNILYISRVRAACLCLVHIVRGRRRGGEMGIEGSCIFLHLASCKHHLIGRSEEMQGLHMWNIHIETIKTESL